MVDARCRDLTNSAVCEKGRADPGSVELCDWHEVRICGSFGGVGRALKPGNIQNLGKLDPGALIPPGIWTLSDVLEHGKDKGICPYFAVRRMVGSATEPLDVIQFISVCFRCHSWT